MKHLKLTPEQAAKVAKARARAESAPKVDREWLLISEFGYYYGWEGVKAILENEIDLETVTVLLQGSRKVWYSKVIDTAVANRVAFVAAQSKKGNTVMKKGLEKFIKELKVDAN